MSLSVTDTQIAYRRSSGTRWFCALATPFIAALFASLPILVWPAPAWFRERAPLDILAFLVLPLLVCLLGLGFVGAGLYGAGPEEVDIDLQTRPYRFRRGFPLLAGWAAR